jgi:hypothetical protein
VVTLGLIIVVPLLATDQAPLPTPELVPDYLSPPSWPDASPG